LVISEVDQLPQLFEGEEVRCEMVALDGPYFAESVVTRQIGDTVWISTPATWTRRDRRRAERTEAYLVVECQFGDHPFRAACLDLSNGGMRISSAEILAPFSRVQVRFTLPDTGERMELPSIVMQSMVGSEEGRFISGLKFSGITPTVSARLAAAFFER
jgi:c-di-GMP-binding flagellar brake protein YcgR